jgi:hypothetical protein
MTSTPQPLDDRPTAIPRPKWLLGFYVGAVLLLLAGALEMGDALLTAGNFGTRYERPTDRPLVWSEISGAAVVLLAGLSFILQKRLSWRALLLLQLLAVAMQFLPIHATGAALADAIRNGGDTGSLSALGHQISLLLEYGIAGLCLLTTGYLCLGQVRQSFLIPI